MPAILIGRPVRLAVLVASCVFAATVAQASAAIRVVVSPTTASRGQTVTLRGAGWGVIEYCRPSVTLTLERPLPLKPLLIATVKLGTAPTTSGTFATRWKVPLSVQSGLRTLVATQRCESGKNGAPVLITRSTALRIR